METNQSLTTEFVTPQNAHLRPLTFLGGIGVALLFLVVQVLTMIPVLIGVMAVYGFNDKELVMEAVMTLGLPLGFIAGAWVLSKNKGLRNTAYEWKSNFLFLTIVGLFLTFSVSYIVGTIMTYLPGYESMMESYKAMLGDIDPMKALLTIAVIGPLCEEIVFRGIVLEGLLKKYDVKKAILFSAIVFSVIHLQPLQIIATFFIGLILGWIYVKTQSLWVCIWIHVVNNFVAVMTMDASMDTSPASYFDNNVLYIGSLVLAAGIAYLAYLKLSELFERERV